MRVSLSSCNEQLIGLDEVRDFEGYVEVGWILVGESGG